MVLDSQADSVCKLENNWDVLSNCDYADEFQKWVSEKSVQNC